MFNQRKNKSFQYKPRFTSEKDSTSNSNSDDASIPHEFKSKWRQDSYLNKRKVKGVLSVRVLILILVLLLIGMYILETKFV